MAVSTRRCTGSGQHKRDTGRIIVWDILVPCVESEAGQGIDSRVTEARAPGCTTQGELALAGSVVVAPPREDRESGETEKNEEL